MTFALTATMLEPKPVENTRRGGIATVSFLVGLGFGLLLMSGGEQQTAVEEPSLQLFQQFTQATRALPTMARPIASQNARQFLQPVAASLRDDAPIVGRREAMAAGIAGLSLPAFAGEAAPAPAAPAIASFPVQGDPTASLKKLQAIVTHSWGSGKVLESSDTGFKAKLVTIERVLTADLKQGEKLKVGEQKVEHMYKDFAEFTYNPASNAIDVTLDTSKSLPGKGAKILESYREAYLTGKRVPVGEIFLREGTRESQQSTPTRIMRKGKVGENINQLPKGLS